MVEFDSLDNDDLMSDCSSTVDIKDNIIEEYNNAHNVNDTAIVQNSLELNNTASNKTNENGFDIQNKNNTTNVSNTSEDLPKDAKETESEKINETPSTIDGNILFIIKIRVTGMDQLMIN